MFQRLITLFMKASLHVIINKKLPYKYIFQLTLRLDNLDKTTCPFLHPFLINLNICIKFFGYKLKICDKIKFKIYYVSDGRYTTSC